MKKNFVQEIEYLLSLVPKEQWKDPTICGVMYELLPWHGSSTLTIQTREDNPRDIGAWKYYFSADSDTTRIKKEIAKYQKAKDCAGVYHRLLIEAAEAFLSIDLSQYGQAMTLFEDHLYKPFRMQVYHADRVFDFNYCEYVLAKRLDSK